MVETSSGTPPRCLVKWDSFAATSMSPKSQGVPKCWTAGHRTMLLRKRKGETRPGKLVPNPWMITRLKSRRPETAMLRSRDFPSSQTALDIHQELALLTLNGPPRRASHTLSHWQGNAQSLCFLTKVDTKRLVKYERLQLFSQKLFPERDTLLLEGGAKGTPIAREKDRSRKSKRPLFFDNKNCPQRSAVRSAYGGPTILVPTGSPIDPTGATLRERDNPNGDN